MVCLSGDFIEHFLLRPCGKAASTVFMDVKRLLLNPNCISCKWSLLLLCEPEALKRWFIVTWVVIF